MNKKKRKILNPKYRFSKFNNKWEYCELGSIANKVTKKNTLGKITRVLTNSASEGIVDQGDYFERTIVNQNNIKNYFIIKQGDFVYNPRISSIAPVGPISRNNIGDGIISPLYTVFRFNNKNNNFYEQYYKTSLWHKYLKEISNQGARFDRMSILDEDFFNMPIPYNKDSEELQEIANSIISIDNLILLEEEKLGKFKSHKKGLLQKLFPKDNKSMPELRFPQYKEQWLLEKLIKKVIYKNGKAHEDSIVINGRYIVVNSKFISTNGLIKKYSNSPNLLAKKGDILVVLSDVPNGKALGKCFMVDKDETYTVNQRVCCLTPVNIDTKYLFFILNRNNYFLSFDDGIGQTNLKKEDVLAFSFYAPQNSKEQQKIANCISSIDDLISAQTRKIELLKQHKKGLLQGLFPSIKEVEND